MAVTFVDKNGNPTGPPATGVMKAIYFKLGPRSKDTLKLVNKTNNRTWIVVAYNTRTKELTVQQGSGKPLTVPMSKAIETSYNPEWS